MVAHGSGLSQVAGPPPRPYGVRVARGKSSSKRKPQGRISRAFERVALGAIMSVVAFVLERRLLKALRRRGEKPDRTVPRDVELSAAPENVDEQTSG